MFKPVSPIIQPRTRHTVGLILLTFLLGACGYKGPLYLPPPPNTLNTAQESAELPVIAADSITPDVSTGFESQRLETVPIEIE